jgi:hypothetical protein
MSTGILLNSHISSINLINGGNFMKSCSSTALYNLHVAIASIHDTIYFNTPKRAKSISPSLKKVTAKTAENSPVKMVAHIK